MKKFGKLKGLTTEIYFYDIPGGLDIYRNVKWVVVNIQQTPCVKQRKKEEKKVAFILKDPWMSQYQVLAVISFIWICAGSLEGRCGRQN